MSLSSRDQIKRSFSRAATSYNAAASHQNHIAEQLVNYTKSHVLLTPQLQVIDLGSGTGFVGDYCQHSSIIHLDLSDAMLKNHGSNLSLCADIQRLPLKPSTFDLCLSSYAFQWSKNIDLLFKEIYKTLKPDGLIFFSVPGFNTFHELKSAWLNVDTEIHAHDFLTQEAWQQSATQQGFKMLYHSEQTSLLTFQSVRDSLQHIKNIGAHNLNAQRPKYLLGKQRYQKFMEAFKQHSQFSSGYSLSYQTFFFGFIKPLDTTKV